MSELDPSALGDLTAPKAPVAAPVTTPAPSAGAAPSTQAPPAAAPGPAAPREPNFLAQRLKEERRSVLKKVGIEVGKDDDVDEVLSKLKEQDRGAKKENKILRKALAEFQDQLKTTTEKAQTLDQGVAALLQSELALLPEAARERVKATLTGDAGAQLKQLAALKALGATFSAPSPATPPATPAPAAMPGAPPAQPPDPVAAPPAAAHKPPLAAPASTAPAAGAPPPPSPGAPEDHGAVYRDLKASNPLLASQYLLWHSDKIFPDKQIVRK